MTTEIIYTCDCPDCNKRWSPGSMPTPVTVEGNVSIATIDPKSGYFTSTYHACSLEHAAGAFNSILQKLIEKKNEW